MRPSKIIPDFSHRIIANTPSHDDFLLSVWVMADRAIAVLNLLSLHVKPTDGTSQSAIDSVTNELLDVQKYVQAFAESQTNTQ